MGRCPVPYALVALLSWGLGDALVTYARVRWRALMGRLRPVRAGTG